MHRIQVIDQRHVQVGVEGRHLVVVERREQPVLPPKRGVRVDNHRLLLVHVGEDVLEHRPSQGVQPGQREVENLAGSDVGRLGVHQVADVVDVYVVTA